MKILNYRECFAANSSSTHSTLFLNDNIDIKSRVYQIFNYNWENFILKEPSEINEYVISQIISNIRARTRNHNINSNIIAGYLYSIFNDQNLFNYDFNNEDLFNIDHQSQWVLPHDIHDSYRIFPSINFIKDLLIYLKSNNTIICGGNDNSGDIDENIINNSTQPKIINRLTYMNSCYCYKDPKYNFWTLFNNADGTKISFSFDDNTNFEKSYTPHLVDLIISDLCYNKCTFCYRNCTENGKFADPDKIYNYLKKLYQLNVFEVAIGGGDILKYPYFDELCDIIKNFKDELVINTTIYASSPSKGSYYFNNLKENRSNINEQKIIELLKSFKSVAFSVNNIGDLNRIEKYLNLKDENDYNMSIQIIPELLFNNHEFDNIMEKYSSINKFVPITLLGFKSTGRGKNYKLQNNIDIINLIKKHFKNDYIKCNYAKFNIDTQFIHNFPELKNILSPISYTEFEGKFSCCINAINDTISKSSYGTEWFNLKLDDYDSKDWGITELYGKF